MNAEASGATRILRLGALAAVVAGAPGCFHTQTTRADALAPIRAAALADDTVLDADDAPDTDVLFGGVRLDPNSSVRFRRQDGTYTSWVSARSLRLGVDGVFVDTRPVEWKEVSAIVITGLEAPDVERLRLTAPQGAEVDAPSSDYVRLATHDGQLHAWMRDFVSACDAARVPVRGRWELRGDRPGPLPLMDGVDLRVALDEALQVADGVRWMDVSGAEISNLDGAMTFLAIIVIPLSLAAGHVPEVGEGIRADALGVPTVEPQTVGLRALGRADLVAPRREGARGLFSDDALRKSSTRWVLWTSATSQVTKAQQMAFTAGAAVRLRDVFELGLGASSYWRAPFTPGHQLPGPPLEPGPDARVPEWMGLVRGLLHLDVDPARRVALPVGFDFAASPGGTAQLRLRYGVRIRPTPSFVLTLYPFNAQYTALPPDIDPGGEAWTFPWTVEAVREF